MALLSYAKCVADMAKKGAKIAKKKGLLESCGKMCDTCAFRWEQVHTLPYILAADQAAYQLMSEGEFNCHTWDFKDAQKPCAGFQFAKLVFEPDEEK